LTSCGENTIIGSEGENMIDINEERKKILDGTYPSRIISGLKDFQIILEESAYEEKEIKIKTKDRGTITGMYIVPDEFDTDPDRYGFQIEIGEHEFDIVFLDEIVEINVFSEAKRIFRRNSRNIRL